MDSGSEASNQQFFYLLEKHLSTNDTTRTTNVMQPLTQSKSSQRNVFNSVRLLQKMDCRMSVYREPFRSFKLQLRRILCHDVSVLSSESLLLRPVLCVGVLSCVGHSPPASLLGLAWLGSSLP